MEGSLWTKLADYHIQLGSFEDFTLIFDTYVKFEEGIVEALMEILQDDDDSNEKEQIKQEPTEDSTLDLDILLGDIQTSDPQQSQNFSANSYQEQAKICMVIATMEEAIKAVDTKKSLNGSPYTLYTTLASIHETQKKDADGARQIYK
eukprot:1316396-Ditylum_brightwellii.AAC.1